MTKQLQLLQNKINELPAKQYAMMLSLIVLLSIRFAFIPWYQDLQQQQSQLEQLSSVTKDPELMKAQLQQLQSELDSHTMAKEYWQDKFYVGDENQVKIEFANKVNQWANKYNLNVLRSKWGRVSKRQREKYSQLQVQKYDITVRASYKDFLNFLAFIQQQSPLIQPTNIAISKRDVQGVATTTLSLTVLYKES